MTSSSKCFVPQREEGLSGRTGLCHQWGGSRNWTALVPRFASEGYRIAMLARTTERLADLAAQVPSAKAYVCDVSDQSEVDSTMALVEREMGAPSVLIHNAVGGAWGTFMEVDPATLNRNFQVNTMGSALPRAAPRTDHGDRWSGSHHRTGNTSAQRGRANFADFAPTKAAQRILAEAMARDLGPKGVHVAYIVIDAVIDVPWAASASKPSLTTFSSHPQQLPTAANGLATALAIFTVSWAKRR